MSFLGSLKKVAGNVGKTVAKAAKDTAKQTVRSTKDVGHVAGDIATSVPGKVILGGVLAASGVGAVAAAEIGAATGVVGGTIKHHGGLKEAVKQGAEGAGVGLAGATVGAGVRAARDKTGLGGFKNGLLHGKGFNPAEGVPDSRPPMLMLPDHPTATDVPDISSRGVVKPSGKKSDVVEKETQSHGTPERKPTPNDSHKASNSGDKPHTQGARHTSGNVDIGDAVRSALASSGIGGGGSGSGGDAAPAPTAADAGGGFDMKPILIIGAVAVGALLLVGHQHD